MRAESLVSAYQQSKRLDVKAGTSTTESMGTHDVPRTTEILRDRSRSHAASVATLNNNLPGKSSLLVPICCPKHAR
ncbi:hypothetical protein VSDG_01478 [Cytospora chrysosperma]|uniref:Uncharacterized protein n=1 Tax=Cytospora chrysosperma TaxID=252740 RepID=A0A423WJ53_CYTCH|nr:hypothetical protein VSDG_01478 [Valsa sordida]